MSSSSAVSINIEALCTTCGFAYGAHKGHLIPCPVCALARCDALLWEVLSKMGCHTRGVNDPPTLPERIERELG